MINPAIDETDVRIRQNFIAAIHRRQELKRLLFWSLAVLSGAVLAGLIPRI
jgi:hypothetical protein